uniref:PWI domain-containing protein n=1 Tax=Schizophyllum commune (strain H4-8 / FGSC 9210) TaxID=578458 RepID=D8QH47_SCHCM
MADAGFFKGTSADQDRRFSDKELKLLKSMKFPPEFDQKVDMRKVNLQVIRPWVFKKITELNGIEDELVGEYCMGLLEDESQPTPDPKRMTINLQGFLNKNTKEFMVALWKLLLEAQAEVSGVPRTFVEEKKEELRKARENDTRALDERDRRVSPRRRPRSPTRSRTPPSSRGGSPVPRARYRSSSPGRSPPPRRPRSPSERSDSRTPPRRRRSVSGSPPRRRSPPPRKRLSRSPPPRRRDSRSPPPRRRDSPPRRRRPSPPPRSRSRSLSRERSPPPRSRRRFSPSPPRRSYPVIPLIHAGPDVSRLL